MASAYGWETLECVGDFVVCRGKTAKQVSSMAKTYVERRYGTEAVVAAVTVPPGDTVVFLAYVPPKAEAPPPTPVEPTVKPATKADQRREAKERRDTEMREKQRKSGAATNVAIAREVEGYAPYVPNKPSRDDIIYAKLMSAKADGFTKEELEELEAYLEATTPKDVELPAVDVVEDEDEDDD